MFIILSIIIPVFNRQEGLNKLISDLSKAILADMLENQVEIIVIDDASEVPVTLIESKAKVLLHRSSKNFGAPLSRKKGFQLSKGAFIHFHDSDDSVASNWLSEVMNEVSLKPYIDLLMTARIDNDKYGSSYRSQKYFHKQVNNPAKIQTRLVYRNCMGPLGGVTFSRNVLEKIDFKAFSSCQDWQMYIDAIKHSKVLCSRPDIQFIFNKMGDDRISGDARKKILGHLQLAELTSQSSLFNRNIRLFYLYTCKQHIYNHGGEILRFYEKNKLKIIWNYLLVSLFWRLR